MYDATAKVPAGLLSGNVNQFGDFDECVSVESKDGIQGQYCLAYLQLTVDQSRPDLKYLHRLLHSHYAFRSNISDVSVMCIFVLSYVNQRNRLFCNRVLLRYLTYTETSDLALEYQSSPYEFKLFVINS